jgi:hypothetical protein
MAKETRLAFTPPPPPKADPKDLAMWARRLTVLLPLFLGQMQQVLLETQSQTYDINVPVPEDENIVTLEAQTDLVASAGEI